jgi:hypothetical protein
MVFGRITHPEALGCFLQAASGLKQRPGAGVFAVSAFFQVRLRMARRILPHPVAFRRPSGKLSSASGTRTFLR